MNSADTRRLTKACEEGSAVELTFDSGTTLTGTVRLIRQPEGEPVDTLLLAVTTVMSVNPFRVEKVERV